MQPSYPDGSSTLANGIYGTTDAGGNYRRYSYTLFAVCNYTCGTLTWKVDGVTNGNAQIGTISIPTGMAAGEVTYTSADAAHQGNHSITAVDVANSVTSSASVISVSSTAPILGYDYKPMSEKNGFECKCVNKLLFENNYLENGWGANGNGGGQVGTMTLFQAINQTNQTNDGNGVNVGYGPPYVNNVTYRNNYGRHFGTGFTVVPLNVAQGLHNILITGNACDDCNSVRNGNGFLKIVEMISTGGTASKTVLGWTSPTNPLAANIAFTHDTLIGASTNTFSLQNYIAQFQLKNFTFQDNIIASGNTTGTFINANGEDNDANQGNSEALAMQGAGWNPVPIGSCKAPSSSHTWYCNVSGVGWEISVAGAAYTPTATPPGAVLFSPYVFDHNELLDSATSPANFTSSPIWLLDHTAAKFVNYGNGNGGDYRLCTTALCGSNSPFASGQADQASDGRDLGADVQGLATVVQNALTGSRAGLPLSIATTSLPDATHGVAYSQTLAVTGGVAPFTWSTPASVAPVGAEDVLDYFLMADRNSFHLTGDAVKYFHLDNGLIEWMKANTGHPIDGEMFDEKNVYQWITEGPTFGNASGYKKYVNPVPLWKRYHVPGADDVVYTPGPNKYDTTESCGSDNLPQIDNLGVRGEETGPFTDVTWATTYGGSIPDHTPYLFNQKWIKCTANNILNCQTEEDYWNVLNYGQVRWCTKHLSGGVYVVDQCSTNTTKAAGGAPTLNFACGVPALPITNALPAGTALTSAPSLNLGDSTGTISGTALAAGTSTFTVQVEDAAHHTATQTFTLVVH
jgi:hypothetical protein